MTLGKKIVSFLCFLSILLPMKGQDFPDKTNPPRLVNDFAGFFTVQEANMLENKLVAFNDSTSTQIAVVTVKSLGGYDKSDYAFKLAEKWGIGQKGKNNGILILIKPKTENEKGEAFIAVGYGLEPVIPDAIARRVVDNEMLPNFREKQNFQGVDKAVSVLISLANKEFTAAQYAKVKPRKDQTVGGWVFFVIIFFVVIFSIIGKIGKARNYSIGHDVPFWTALWMLGMMNSSRTNHWNDFSSGGGVFGGGGGDFGGGGGFGGFGGGSFGGGGAGGSW
jgi:uncharacterized protein